MKKYIFFVLFVISICGCTSNQFDKYESIDLTAKTITVPPGSDGPLRSIKRSLIGDDWKLFTDTKGARSVQDGNVTDHFTVSRSKYRLNVTYGRTIKDVCFNFEHYIMYEITIINNETGTEVLNLLTRNRCGYDSAGPELIKALYK